MYLLKNKYRWIQCIEAISPQC